MMGGAYGYAFGGGFLFCGVFGFLFMLGLVFLIVYVIRFMDKKTMMKYAKWLLIIGIVGGILGTLLMGLAFRGLRNDNGSYPFPMMRFREIEWNDQKAVPPVQTPATPAPVAPATK